MMLTERLHALMQLIDDLHRRVHHDIDEIRREFAAAERSWPDHQVVQIEDWKPRTVTPPAGVAWASDGLRVWIIWCDGKPIAESATAVKFWTVALIPAPPPLQEIKVIEPPSTQQVDR